MEILLPNQYIKIFQINLDALRWSTIKLSVGMIWSYPLTNDLELDILPCSQFGEVSSALPLGFVL